MRDMKKQFAVWETAALLALSLTLCLGVWAQARQNGISGNLVRLHVLAASDAPEEQALKLRVRDAVLDYLRPILMEAKTAEEARALLDADLAGIACAAAAVSEGRQVRVSLNRERYPTRLYEGFSLPAGSYDSLRVVLGEGTGQNWWCVVFPPLCLTAAEEEPLQSVMGGEDFALVSGSGGHVLRFRAVELWGELTEIFDR
jgi:stage II sporulation protein R